MWAILHIYIGRVDNPCLGAQTLDQATTQELTHQLEAQTTSQGGLIATVVHIVQGRLITGFGILEGEVLSLWETYWWEGGLSWSLREVTEDAGDFTQERRTVEATHDDDRHPLCTRPQITMKGNHLGKAQGACLSFSLWFTLGNIRTEDAIQTTLQMTLEITRQDLLQTTRLSYRSDERCTCLFKVRSSGFGA